MSTAGTRWAPNFPGRCSTSLRARLDVHRLPLRQSPIKHAAFGSGTVVSHYVGCSFRRHLPHVARGFTRFERCAFRNLRVTKSAPDYLEFVDCTFTGRVAGVRSGRAAPGSDARYERHVAWLAGRGEPVPPG